MFLELETIQIRKKKQIFVIVENYIKTEILWINLELKEYDLLMDTSPSSWQMEQI